MPSRIWKQLPIAAFCLLSTFAMPSQVCLPSGFPGQGSAAAWSDALPYYNRGNRYLNQQRFADAASDYREAISRYPYDPDFFINLGVACRKLDDYLGAEQAFKAAIELNDKDWSAWMDLGNAYLKQNRLQDTLHAFERSLKCNPPAADRAVLVSNVSDIHKVLRNLGQEPMQSPPQEAASARKLSHKAASGQSHTSMKQQLATKHQPTTKQNSHGQAVPAAVKTTPTTEPALGPTKDWGYQ